MEKCLINKRINLTIEEIKGEEGILWREKQHMSVFYKIKNLKVIKLEYM